MNHRLRLNCLPKSVPLLSAPPLTVGALRIAAVPRTKLREDFHLLITVHAGGEPRGAGPPPCVNLSSRPATVGPGEAAAANHVAASRSPG